MTRDGLLGLLREVQEDSAPISLTIGEVEGGQVRHDVVVIHDAPAAVLRRVVDYAQQHGRLYNVTIRPNGVRVRFEK